MNENTCMKLNYFSHPDLEKFTTVYSATKWIRGFFHDSPEIIKTLVQLSGLDKLGSKIGCFAHGKIGDKNLWPRYIDKFSPLSIHLQRILPISSQSFKIVPGFSAGTATCLMLIPISLLDIYIRETLQYINFNINLYLHEVALPSEITDFPLQLRLAKYKARPHARIKSSNQVSMLIKEPMMPRASEKANALATQPPAPEIKIIDFIPIDKALPKNIITTTKIKEMRAYLTVRNYKSGDNHILYLTEGALECLKLKSKELRIMVNAPAKQVIILAGTATEWDTALWASRKALAFGINKFKTLFPDVKPGYYPVKYLKEVNAIAIDFSEKAR